MFNNNEWLEHIEAVIDPERDILDPHHHLWPQASMGYNIDELADTSMAMQYKPCLWNAAQPTERRGLIFFDVWVKQRLSRSQYCARTKAPTQIAGIVAHADLRLAEPMMCLMPTKKPPRVSSEVYVMQVFLPEHRRPSDPGRFRSQPYVR